MMATRASWAARDDALLSRSPFRLCLSGWTDLKESLVCLLDFSLYLSQYEEKRDESQCSVKTLSQVQLPQVQI